jgi:hypothetical protein
MLIPSGVHWLSYSRPDQFVPNSGRLSPTRNRHEPLWSTIRIRRHSIAAVGAQVDDNLTRQNLNGCRPIHIDVLENNSNFVVLDFDFVRRREPAHTAVPRFAWSISLYVNVPADTVTGPTPILHLVLELRWTDIKLWARSLQKKAIWLGLNC